MKNTDIEVGDLVTDAGLFHKLRGRVLCIDGAYAWVYWMAGYRTTVEVKELQKVINDQG